jgi:hypothetical protein
MSLSKIEKPMIGVEGHITIWDPENGEVLVRRRNAINFENMSIAIANLLANESGATSTYGIATMRFGNGGTLIDGLGAVTYKSTNTNHPSAICVIKSYENYEWLWRLLEKVCYEYTYRYGKVHKVQREGLLEELYTPPTHIPKGVGFTEPTPAMPEQFIVPSSISSYKNYYIGAKQHLANWKKREIPNWYY